MPNHVINEVVFRGVDAATRERLLAKIGSGEQKINFELLVPPPVNYWAGSVGSEHEKAFPGNCLGWCTKNWGTKWNAYGIDQGGRYASVANDGDSLVLTFQTAWGPPRGWLVAIFNTFKIGFSYSYLSEGGEEPKRGEFNFAEYESGFGGWKETEVTDDAEVRRLHKLLWGVEAFDDEEDARPTTGGAS